MRDAGVPFLLRRARDVYQSEEIMNFITTTVINRLAANIVPHFIQAANAPNMAAQPQALPNGPATAPGPNMGYGPAAIIQPQQNEVSRFDLQQLHQQAQRR